MGYRRRRLIAVAGCFAGSMLCAPWCETFYLLGSSAPLTQTLSGRRYPGRWPMEDMDGSSAHGASPSFVTTIARRNARLRFTGCSHLSPATLQTGPYICTSCHRSGWIWRSSSGWEWRCGSSAKGCRTFSTFSRKIEDQVHEDESRV